MINTILDRIITEIKEEYEGCEICEWFEDYDCDDNNISEYMPVGSISDIINIINKHRVTSEPVGTTEVKYDPATIEYFKEHPEAQTTVCKCSICGVMYKASLGHICSNRR